ncbi:unnamed protein product [Urochloa humidicola]
MVAWSAGVRGSAHSLRGPCHRAAGRARYSSSRPSRRGWMACTAPDPATGCRRAVVRHGLPEPSPSCQMPVFASRSSMLAALSGSRVLGRPPRRAAAAGTGRRDPCTRRLVTACRHGRARRSVTSASHVGAADLWRAPKVASRTHPRQSRIPPRPSPAARWRAATAPTRMQVPMSPMPRRRRKPSGLRHQILHRRRRSGISTTGSSGYLAAGTRSVDPASPPCVAPAPPGSDAAPCRGPTPHGSGAAARISRLNCTPYDACSSSVASGPESGGGKCGVEREGGQEERERAWFK